MVRAGSILHIRKRTLSLVSLSFSNLFSLLTGIPLIIKEWRGKLLQKSKSGKVGKRESANDRNHGGTEGTEKRLFS